MTAAIAAHPKRGRFSFLRRKKNKTETPVDSKKEDVFETPPPSPTSYTPEPKEESRQAERSKKAFTKDGIPVVTGDNPDDFVPSDVRKTTPGGSAVTKAQSKKSRVAHRNIVTLDKAPTARESAFSGPPRYDWIDVETAAAVKVQAAYRRNKVMSELAAQGVSTAAIRNRARRRKARQQVQVSEDTPFLFRCCGVGLVFGDGTEEDYLATRAHEKEQYEEKKRVKAEKEEELRKYKSHKKPSGHMMEAVEVVEDEEEEF